MQQHAFCDRIKVAKLVFYQSMCCIARVVMNATGGTRRNPGVSFYLISVFGRSVLRLLLRESLKQELIDQSLSRK